MPIPEPKPGESVDDFVSRCMADPVMVDDYPNGTQRYAVCHAQIGQKAKPSRERELAIRLRLSMGIERSYSRQYAALLNKYATQAASGFEHGNRRGAMVAMGSFANDLRPILHANILDAANLIGKRTMDSFSKARKEAPSAFEAAVMRYLSLYGVQKVTSISDTTVQAILAAIAAGEADGEPITVIARSIRESIGGVAATHRATTIAITETHSAASYASQEAAKATGLRLQKEWVSAEDARTRPTHLEADGQMVGMDESFNVGGSLLKYPGDPAGPASETIRCRCIEVYHEEGG